MTAPAVLELPLDDTLLKVLSSDSRREILRLLAERRMTGAELAQRLDLGKPAVAEHLKKLLESGLIERFDDAERRWVYYGLSPRGKSILEPQRVRFYLVLAVAGLALMAGMALALGLVVFLQHGGAGAAAGLGAQGTDGQSSGDVSQGGLATLPVGATTSPPLGSVTQSAPTSASSPTLYHGNGTRGSGAAQNSTFTIVTTDGQPVPSAWLRSGGTVVFGSSDVDSARGVVHVTYIPSGAPDAAQQLANATSRLGTSSVYVVPVAPDAVPTLSIGSSPAGLPQIQVQPANATVPDATTTTTAPSSGTSATPTSPTPVGGPADTATEPASTTVSTTSSSTATSTATTAASASSPLTQASTTAPSATSLPSATVPANTATSLPTSVAPTASATGAPITGQPTQQVPGLATTGATVTGLAPQAGTGAAREPSDTIQLPLVAILAAAALATVLRVRRQA